jgi:hypothetical protein
VTLRLDAAQHVFVVEQAGRVVTVLPIKGLVGKRLPFAAYVSYLGAEARAERQRRAHGSRQLRLW